MLTADGVSVSFGGVRAVSDVSLEVGPDELLGLVGPNGSGKTTLLNLLTGAVKPDAGTVRLGANLVMATLDQQRESLDPNKTVTETLTAGSGDTLVVGGRSRHVLGYQGFSVFSRAGAHPARSVVGWRARPPHAGAGAGQAR